MHLAFKGLLEVVDFIAQVIETKPQHNDCYNDKYPQGELTQDYCLNIHITLPPLPRALRGSVSVVAGTNRVRY